MAGHYGYDTFNAPSGAGVKFVPLGHYGGGVGRCFDYSFISPAGGPQSDIIMYAKVGSTWTKVSDDTDGLFPRFRVWVGASWLDFDPQGQSLRLSAYSSGTNSAHFIIKRTMIAGTQAYCESTGAVVSARTKWRRVSVRIGTVLEDALSAPTS